ncbi:MAG: transcriptional initiation protein Tat [Pseudomonadales bacterium]|nr:transcriptional initiation protein Tat [Pseudomonadales bacterium]
MRDRELESVLAQQLAPLTRRGFLRAGCSVAMATAGGLWSVRDAWADEVLALPSDIEYLTLLEYRVLNKMRLVFIAPELLGMPSTVEIPVMHNIDNMVGHLSKSVRANVNLAGKIFEYSPGYRFSRFSSMSNESARAYMERWQRGYFFQRGLITSLKSLVALAYWRDARVNPFLDYDGPVSVRWGVRKLGNAPLPNDL